MSRYVNYGKKTDAKKVFLIVVSVIFAVGLIVGGMALQKFVPIF